MPYPNRFQLGNKAAETLTKDVVLEILRQMLELLSTPTDPTKNVDNIVKANSIKTIQEVYLAFDVDPDQWSYIKKKFAKDPDVLRGVKKIEAILEARILYSGSVMDIFLLKNKYGYADAHELTGRNGAPLEGPRTAVINYAALSDEVLEALWNAQLKTIEDPPEDQKQLDYGSNDGTSAE